MNDANKRLYKNVDRRSKVYQGNTLQENGNIGKCRPGFIDSVFRNEISQNFGIYWILSRNRLEKQENAEKLCFYTICILTWINK